MTPYQLPARATSKRTLPKGTAVAVGGTVAALAVAALVNRYLARKAERDNRRRSSALCRPRLRYDHRATAWQRKHDPGF
jgi:hypothetical protein